MSRLSALPFPLKIVVGYIVITALSTAYTVYRFGSESWMIDVIYVVLFPLIAVGLVFRQNLARLALMAFSVLMILIAFGFFVFALYMQYLSKTEIDHFSFQPAIIIGIAILIGGIHFAIYRAMCRKDIKQYFSHGGLNENAT